MEIARLARRCGSKDRGLPPLPPAASPVKFSGVRGVYPECPDCETKLTNETAVVNYQMELMTAMNGINDKIERHNHPAESEEDGEAALAAQRGKTVDFLYFVVRWFISRSIASISLCNLFSPESSDSNRFHRTSTSLIPVLPRCAARAASKYKKSTVSRCLLSQRCVVHSS
jgi:hypothetical protein